MNLFSTLLFESAVEEKELGFFWGKHRHYEGKTLLPEPINEGILAWNSYQDIVLNSEEFLQCKELLNLKLRKHTVPIINSLIEHVICKHWEQLSKADLIMEMDRFKEVLNHHTLITPYSLRKVSRWVVKTETSLILGKAATIRGLHELLKLESAYNQCLDLAIMDLIQSYNLFEKLLLQFLLKLVANDPIVMDNERWKSNKFITEQISELP